VSELLKTPEQRKWAKVHAAALVIVVFFYAFSGLNRYLWMTVSAAYMQPAAILLYR